MSVKDFFKSNSFKCLAALLCVLLASGIFLTIAYGFLEVTAGERLQRAVSYIYSGADVSVYGENDVLITAEAKDPQGLISETKKTGNAEIDQAYKVTFDENGKKELDYLISSKGFGGWSGGTVTCWIAVTVENGAVTGIRKISVSSWGNQTLSSEVNSSSLFENITSKYTDGIYYEPVGDFLVTGATMSATAICNAVNGAIAFVKTDILGGVVSNPFEGFVFTEYIDIANPATIYQVDGETVTYNIITKSNKQAQAFTIEITVGKGGVISEYVIKKYGSTDGRLDKDEYNALVRTDYEGKDAAYFKSVIGENGDISSNENYEAGEIQTGATRSNYLCLYSGLFATANYEKCLGGQMQ